MWVGPSEASGCDPIQPARAAEEDTVKATLGKLESFSMGVTLALALAACSSGGAGSPGPTGTQPCTTLNPADPDTDGEGLPDCYEVNIGTSPADQDSDGDGLDDHEEVVTKAFDPTINNFQFNPRIADVPDITVQLQGLPDVFVTFTDSTQTSQERSLTEGSRSTTTLARSHTYEQSVGEEVSGTVGSSGGTGGFNVSSGTTYSQSQQETMSWTTAEAQENSSFQETTETETSQYGVTNTGGEIAVLLKVRNRGYQTITLSSMTVTALQVDPRDPTRQKLVTGMDYDTSSGSFPTFDIGPNAESNSLPFRAELTLGKIYDLLRDSRNLSIEPTTWSIADQDGRSYTHNLTNVHARSAQVVIDYAGAAGRELENHYVATVTDFQKNRISAATALTDVLKVPYTEGMSSATYTGTRRGLLSARNVVNDDAVHGRWVVAHNYLDTDGITRLSKTYDSTRGDYSLADIQVAKGEVLHLMYYRDQDGDGLGSREEFLHGTSDTDPDFDDDGLTDHDETKGGWEVPVTKSLLRTVHSDPKVADADNDALLDGDERTRGTNPNRKDTDDDGTLDGSDTTLTVADMQEVAFLPLTSTSLNDASINPGVGTSGTHGYTADRFGVASAALNMASDADRLDVTGAYGSAPAHGATLVLWVKVSPTLPLDGWNLYEHKSPPNSFADQFFWIFPSGFTVFGDGADHHSVFVSQNELFSTLPFADWHMLAMVGEEESVGGGMTRFNVYYDAQLYSSVSNPSPLVQFLTNPWYFAGPTTYAVSVGEYRGALDDIRFFRRALDGQEVALLYESHP
jgi:hypothetical protein